MHQNGNLSNLVLEAVALREELRVEQLTPPLYEVIDPEALDHLFRESDGSITFTYRGYTVTAHTDGRVELASTG